MVFSYRSMNLNVAILMNQIRSKYNKGAAI